jgi:type I restriction enzyme S subunit
MINHSSTSNFTKPSTPRLKHHLSALFSGGTPETGKEEYWSNDDTGIPWVAIGDMSNRDLVEITEKRITDAGLRARGLVVLPKGTLIYSMYASLGHVAELAIPATFNQAILGFQFRPHVEQQYIKWQLRHLQARIVEEASSNTQDNLNAEKVRNLPIPLPPLPTQRAIATYLDNEVGRLDALLTKKSSLLDLLAEKRSALITRAVTRGLDPAAPLRDSGFPWLGQVPNHWRVERSKWLFKERDERIENDEGEMLTVSHITGVTLRSEKDVNMFEAETTEGYKICLKGDLAINTLWAWMGAMGIAPCDGIVSPAYNVYTPGPEMDRGYVEALVRMPTFVQEITRYSTGVWSSRLRLYPEGFFEAWLPVPPLAEQHAIVAHIATAAAKLDGLRAAAERTIALLKERRAALIAAAVTGKLKIN